MALFLRFADFALTFRFDAAFDHAHFLLSLFQEAPDGAIKSSACMS